MPKSLESLKEGNHLLHILNSVNTSRLSFTRRLNRLIKGIPQSLIVTQATELNPEDIKSLRGMCMTVNDEGPGENPSRDCPPISESTGGEWIETEDDDGYSEED